MAGGRELPEDVLRDVLCMLPVKSLMRFKCVCKSWYALIKSPDFIHLHLHLRRGKSKSDSSLIVKRCLEHDHRNVLSLFSSSLSTTTTTDTVDIDIPFSKVEKYAFLLGPCNGIICITNLYQIVLCNPAIREFRSLSVPNPFHNPDNMVHAPIAVGFGFDPNTGGSDYKVVRIVHHYYDDEFDTGCIKTEVYNLSSDSWREIDAVPSHISHSPCCALLFNGAFHWYAGKGDGDVECILSFHISNEVFQMIPFPDTWSSYVDGHFRGLAVLNDSLALIGYADLHSQPHPVENHFDIWVMNEYGVKESWTRRFKIGPLSDVAFPLAFWNNSSELLLETRNGQLVSCNLQGQNIKEFPIRGVPTTLSALIYSESLVSIKREYETEESA